MLDFSGSTTVYLACGVTDLRKSYTGLAAIIKLKFHLDKYTALIGTAEQEIAEKKKEMEKQTAVV